ncbi:hypothetical protein GLOTRDRAFT_46032, partial [Gloeophyllum trabeum ATCC 11539]
AAPATSVNVECNFSSRQQTIIFMQHNMSLQTFRAEMVISSWQDAPFSSSHMPYP